MRRCGRRRCLLLRSPSSGAVVVWLTSLPSVLSCFWVVYSEAWNCLTYCPPTMDRSRRDPGGIDLGDVFSMAPKTLKTMKASGSASPQRKPPASASASSSFADLGSPLEGLGTSSQRPLGSVTPAARQAAQGSSRQPAQSGYQLDPFAGLSLNDRPSAPQSMGSRYKGDRMPHTITFCSIWLQQAIQLPSILGRSLLPRNTVVMMFLMRCRGAAHDTFPSAAPSSWRAPGAVSKCSNVLQHAPFANLWITAVN